MRAYREPWVSVGNDDRPWYLIVQVWLGLKTRIVAPRNLSSFWGIFTVGVRTLVFNVLNFEEGKRWGLEYSSASASASANCRSRVSFGFGTTAERYFLPTSSTAHPFISPSHTLHTLHTPPRPTPSAPKPTNTALTSLPIRPHIIPRLPALP